MDANAILKDMVGDELGDAAIDARTRLSDATITVRCEAALWLVERAGVTVIDGLSHAEALSHLQGLS